MKCRLLQNFMVTQTQICTAISKFDDHSIASLPQGWYQVKTKPNFEFIHWLHKLYVQLFPIIAAKKGFETASKTIQNSSHCVFVCIVYWNYITHLK